MSKLALSRQLFLLDTGDSTGDHDAACVAAQPYWGFESGQSRGDALFPSVVISR